MGATQIEAGVGVLGLLPQSFTTPLLPPLVLRYHARTLKLRNTVSKLNNARGNSFISNRMNVPSGLYFLRDLRKLTISFKIFKY